MSASKAEVTALLERIDEYALLRDLLRHSDDEQESRRVLDRCLEAWQRLLEARNEVQL